MHDIAQNPGAFRRCVCGKLCIGIKTVDKIDQVGSIRAHTTTQAESSDVNSAIRSGKGVDWIIQILSPPQPGVKSAS